jgi:hypothetical protein
LNIPDHTTAIFAGSGRIDDGRHSVCGIVEAVDELEAERNQQGNE